MTAPSSDLAPSKPTLALTLALAGKREVGNGAVETLVEGLTLAFNAVAARLGALGDMTMRADDPLAERFAQGRHARLTLVTGLADGADQIAADIFTAARQPDNVTRVLGAVLPCTREAYVANSAIADTARFDRQWTASTFVIELDGLMPPAPKKPEPSSPEISQSDLAAMRERAEAFSGQSELLLRQADILVAVDNPGDNGRVGGTRETIHGAFDVGVPVILLRLGEPGLAVLRTRGDLEEPVMLPPGAAHETLADLVDDLIGLAPSSRDADYVDALCEEFFAAEVCHSGWLNRLWDRFEIGFKDGHGPLRHRLNRLRRSRAHVQADLEPPHAPPAATPYDSYKERASILSAYYGGQYRGAFLAGYGLAIIAVFAAIVSLGLMAAWPDEPRPHSILDAWAVAMAGLALLKVAVVVAIYRLAERANSKALAHRAADYRYISERLRAMAYLPKVGSLRPPAPWSLPYTTRVAAQGLMDRLFVSIIRQAEPLASVEGRLDEKVIRPDAATAMRAIRDSWIAGQIAYHNANHAKLKALGGWLEHLGRRLNTFVIVIAFTDLVLLAVETIGLLPQASEPLVRHWVEPTLVGLAAILPAAVASINGVRFQSECTRLADRSLQMAGELSNLERRSWRTGARRLRLIDALHLANDAARLTLDEVAEWAAIYGKEFVEM